MKRIIVALAALATLLVSLQASAQIVKRYPGICTDVSTPLNSAQPEGFLDCDWFKAGTSLANPNYMQIKSWDSNLQLQIETWATIYANGFSGATSERLVLGASVILGLDNTTGNTAEPVRTNGSGAQHIWLKPYKHDADASNCVDITAASVQFTLPTDSNDFEVCVLGTGADGYIRFGANPTATTTTGTGYDMRLMAGMCKFRRIEEAKAAVIGASATGTVCFEQLLRPGQ